MAEGTIRLIINKDSLFSGGFDRIIRCCPDPLPHVGMATSIGGDKRADLHCRNCKKPFGVFAWKSEDPRT